MLGNLDGWVDAGSEGGLVKTRGGGNEVGVSWVSHDCRWVVAVDLPRTFPSDGSEPSLYRRVGLCSSP